jgi:hypothetical protein
LGVKAGGKEEIWPLVGGIYTASDNKVVTTKDNAEGRQLSVAADEVISANIKEADGTSGQNTNSGSGIKTGHIQNAAVTTSKIKAKAVTTGKIADGAVTDDKITGPISAEKINSTGLNADTVDMKHAIDFAASVHAHSGADITSGTVSTERINVGTIAGTVSAGDHNHNATYVNVSGDLMTGRLNLFDGEQLNDTDIYLRSKLDVNHGMGWYGTGKLFAGKAIDGPVLYGWSGGALGTTEKTMQTVLNWRSSGNVGVGTGSPEFGLDVEKATGNTAGKFGPTMPLYLVYSYPTIGFNTYFNGGWKYGKGSIANYGGALDLDPNTGDFNFRTATASGNAGGVMPTTVAVTIQRNGTVKAAAFQGNGSALTKVHDACYIKKVERTIKGLNRDSTYVTCNGTDKAISCGSYCDNDAITTKAGYHFIDVDDNGPLPNRCVIGWKNDSVFDRTGYGYATCCP